MHNYTIQVSFPDDVAQWLCEQAKKRLADLPEHRQLSLSRDTVRDIVCEIVAEAAKSKNGVESTVFTSQQKEEIRQMIQSALDIGST